ncbi:MAG: MAPEG family protein [Pseudomonadales bacterium]
MSVELVNLAAAGVVILILTLIQGTRNVLVLGLPTAAGNQHDIVPWTGWHDRLNRAVRNQIEAVAIFAPFAIAVHGLGLSNEVTTLGAQIFVGARIVHAAVYVSGVPYARTAAWFAGVIGTLMVASPLFS